MKKISLYIYFFFCLFESLSISAQTIPLNDKTIFNRYSFIHTAENRISHEKKLDTFLNKLYLLKAEGRGTVSIVHIGDSHIQADNFTSVVRNNLQQFFGNAGRGLVFPYQLALSNSAPDIGSLSSSTWEFNRVAHPEIPIAPGVSGYCIRSSNDTASFELFVKPTVPATVQTFNRLKFFIGTDSSIFWIVQANKNPTPFLLRNDSYDSSVFKEVVLEQNADSFSITSLPSDHLKEFYGVSLETSMPGIIYHSIGVNGATYDSYNSASLFWQQLPVLKADLYIISLGTNEAQKTGLLQKVFIQQMNLFLEKLKATAPGAAILITTAAGDYYKRHRPNIFLKQINNSIINFCSRNAIALWDMYHITGGYGSAHQWLRRGLMNPDRVHFTGEGYRIQGTLFFNSFAKAYNTFISER